MRRLTPVLLSALVLVPVAGSAQQEELERPVDFEIRTDRAGQPAEDVYFVEMPPGWHITTGPASILWQPEHTASGDYAVEMETYLFDPRGRREAFGFFVGGRDLSGDGQAYTYFLIRDGGQFLVKRRVGGETEVVRDWTPHEAIRSWADRGEEASTRNVLGMEADGDRVRFLVNGEEVAALPRDGLDLDGVVGMRVNHGLNIHVSRLDVTPRG